MHALVKQFAKKHNLTFLWLPYRVVRKSVQLPHKFYSNLIWQPEANRLHHLKDIHQDRKRCFIIGSGPSILKHDLTCLYDEIVFVVNDFALHEQYDIINPTYHCVSDPRFFPDGRVLKEWYEAIRQKTKSIKIIPFQHKPIVDRSKLFINHKLYYLRYFGIPIWQVGTMSLDITDKVYTGDTVIIDFCLPLAFYMGFREVYLLGCDTDYKLNEASDFSQSFFYDVRKSPRERSIPRYEYIVKSYEVAKKEFEKHGRKIFNAGYGGRLEVFSRVSYGEVVQR